MRADMVAAYLDYRDAAELTRAVARGEAPAPTGYHGTGRSREPVWTKLTLDAHAGDRPAAASEQAPKRDLAKLV